MTADSYSRSFQQQRHADYGYVNKSETAQLQLDSEKSTAQRAKEWVSEQRYPIVFGSWVASMGIAFGLVNRNQFLTGAQKLVQARVYAQGLTLAVLLASFGLESNDMRVGKGRWETVKILDPEDPDHKRIIEKRIHHEAYSGEDQWMGMFMLTKIVRQSLILKCRYDRGSGKEGQGAREGSTQITKLSKQLQASIVSSTRLRLARFRLGHQEDGEDGLGGSNETGRKYMI